MSLFVRLYWGLFMDTRSGEREARATGAEQFPSTVRQSGRLAVAFGCLLLLNAAAGLLLTAALFAWVGPEAAFLSVPLSFFTGVLSVAGGLRVMRGKESSASAHAVKAVIYGVVNIAFGALFVGVLLAADIQDLRHFRGGWFYYTRPECRYWALLIAFGNLASGIGLAAGGVLAWRCRREYQRWWGAQ